jgi:preprotein translocase subunit SecG
MYSFILVIHFTVCVGLICIVLLQSGKSGGITGLFGGGGADQVLSAPSGTAFIKKATTVMAIVFMVSSLLLTVLTSRQGFKTVTSQIPMAPVQQQAPAAPVQAPASPAK